jgi:hypothetical protein
MLTVATGMMIIMSMATVVSCYALASLVPHHSPKLGLTYLKNEAH